MNSLPLWFYVIYIFIIGICIGSFLNVVILRGLSGEKFVFERSKCPKCGNQLKWYMNIPLFSYLFLRGKCAFCKEKISIQYPIVEFITGILFLAAFFAFGLSLKTLFLWVIFSFYIILATCDILETVIIDTHAYILFGVCLLSSFFNVFGIDIISSVIGAICAYLFFEILARLGLLIAKFRAFGEGDSLIALSLGAIFGFKNFLILAFLSILIQSLSAIPVLVKKEFNCGNKKLAFSYILVILSIIYVFIINYFSMIESYSIYLISTIITVIFLLWALKNIIHSLRNKKVSDCDEAKKQFNLMPFGPAMIVAALICHFFLAQIKQVIITFLY